MRILPDIAGLSGIALVMGFFRLGPLRLIRAPLMQMRILRTRRFSVLFQLGFMMGHISLLCLRLAVTETPPDILLFPSEKTERLPCSRVGLWCNAKERKMDKDRIEGTAKQAKGNIKEAAGHLSGDAKLKAEGKADKAEGKIQNAVGGTKDAVRDAVKKH
jgi:uncharacterized protein YjbJ (UPF0337 family)